VTLGRYMTVALAIYLSIRRSLAISQLVRPGGRNEAAAFLHKVIHVASALQLANCRLEDCCGDSQCDKRDNTARGPDCQERQQASTSRAPFSAGSASDCRIGGCTRAFLARQCGAFAICNTDQSRIEYLRAFLRCVARPGVSLASAHLP